MNQQKEAKQTEKRGEAFPPRSFVMMQEMSRSDISGISTKAPCEVALMGERHVRIEISAFVMRAFVLMQEMSRSDISGISTKAPCEVALMGERHVRIEISAFVMRTFAARRRHSFARETVCFR